MLKKFVFVLVFYVFACYVSAAAHPLDSVRVEMREGKKFIVHRVIKGDAIPTIASKYAVSESDILSNNPLVGDKVFPGQILKIPVNESKYGIVTVPPVKSLTPSKLPLAKTLPPPNTLVAKEEAKTEAIEKIIDIPDLPSKEEFNSTEYKIYVVASPQTVNQLAAAFSVEPEAIIALNKLKNNNLKEGQKVKIPNQKIQPVVAMQNVKQELAVKVEAPNEVKKPEPNQKLTAKLEEPKEEKKPEPNQKLTAKVEAPKEEKKPEPNQKLTAKVEAPKEEKKLAERKEAIVNSVVKSREIDNFDSLKNTNPAEKSKLEKKIAATNTVNEADKKTNEVASPLTAKMESKKVSIPINQDSVNMAELKKKRNMEQFMKMDSAYIHPDGIAYKPFDYKQDNYSYDLFSTLMAEEHAIVVQHTNQSSGVGDAKKTHVVKKDETLQAIAKKYKVSATDIINWNGLLTYRVRAGQELTINASRADISPYVRTLPTNKKSEQTRAGEDIVGYEKVAGLARYIERQTFTRGVYTNAVEKGRFVYIVNRDNFKEHFAKVIGPLPKGTPEDVVVILDPQSAEQLGITKSLMRVFVYFGVVNPTTEAKND